MPMPHLLQQIAAIIRIENGFYFRDLRLALAAVAVILIPAVYVVIFLASVWDPEGHRTALPVALVNLDMDTRYHDQTFNIGRELTDTLKAQKTFRFVESDDAFAARAMVRRGDAAFALIIPGNFSANALPGDEAGAGKIEVFTSEGNSYQGAAIARRFAADLSQDTNDRLNERRWKLVLTAATGSEQSIERLRSAAAILKANGTELIEGSAKLHRGANELRKRSKDLDAGVARLADGSHDLGKAVSALDARQPAPDDLDRLLAANAELNRGQAALTKGLVELKDGSARLRSGAAEFRDEAQESLFVFSELQAGSSRLAEGAGQLDIGLQEALNAQRSIAEGSTRGHERLGLLIDAAKTQTATIKAIAAGIPPDAQIDALRKGSEAVAGGVNALAEGAERLNEGAQRLGSGFKLLAESLPAAQPGLQGSAEGLSHSVEPQLIINAPVPNHGNAYASNIIPAALWLGAGIAAFLINLRILPRQGASLPPLAQFACKLALPSALVVLQGIGVILTIMFGLKLSIVSPWAVAMTIIVAALTFLVFVLALTRAFGDVGKVLAILFLALQLSSSGGVLPVELSGGLYAQLSPWLPLTWVVKALKAGMFGAFDGEWLDPFLSVAAVGLITVWLASRFGQWQFVDESSIRPPVDV